MVRYHHRIGLRLRRRSGDILYQGWLIVLQTVDTRSPALLASLAVRSFARAYNFSISTKNTGSYGPLPLDTNSRLVGRIRRIGCSRDTVVLCTVQLEPFAI
jgi:hypothetical protein